jgi:hypothetical protein
MKKGHSKLLGHLVPEEKGMEKFFQDLETIHSHKLSMGFI